jgi:hypothetical protein
MLVGGANEGVGGSSGLRGLPRGVSLTDGGACRVGEGAPTGLGLARYNVSESCGDELRRCGGVKGVIT